MDGRLKFGLSSLTYSKNTTTKLKIHDHVIIQINKKLINIIKFNLDIVIQGLVYCAGQLDFCFNIF